MTNQPRSPRGRRARRSKINRKRRERQLRGGCGKRTFRTPEEATQRAVDIVSRVFGGRERMAVYLCGKCGRYHLSRKTTGPGTLVVVEREADNGTGEEL